MYRIFYGAFVAANVNTTEAENYFHHNLPDAYDIVAFCHCNKLKCLKQLKTLKTLLYCSVYLTIVYTFKKYYIEEVIKKWPKSLENHLNIKSKVENIVYI